MFRFREESISYRVNPYSADRNTPPRTTIHRSSCSWVQDNWPGPFATQEEAIAWAGTTGYPIHYCKKCDPCNDTFNATSGPIPTPLLVRDVEDVGVRQPHVQSRPVPLKVSETEHRTPRTNAQKLKLSEVDETLHRGPLLSNDRSIVAGWVWRRRLIAALVLVVVLVLPFLTLCFGQNGGATDAETDSSSIDEKQLYYYMAVAEDRGDLEALKRAGGCAQYTSNMDVAMYSSLSKQLMARYGDEVLAKYGVSQEQWSEIMLKGATERWATPDPPTC